MKLRILGVLIIALCLTGCGMGDSSESPANQIVVNNNNGSDNGIENEQKKNETKENEPVEQVNNEDLQKKFDELQKENESLSKELEQMKNNTDNGSQDDTVSTPEQGGTYLNTLPVFNCQYFAYNKWNSGEIAEWDAYNNRAADGNTYENAVDMYKDYYQDPQRFIVDYLLDGKYDIFNGNFILDENSKSTSNIAKLIIYGDDKIIYECDDITGGFVPQNTGDVAVTDVKKLRFEFVAVDGFSSSTHFGMVFYDSILK